MKVYALMKFGDLVDLYATAESAKRAGEDARPGIQDWEPLEDDNGWQSINEQGGHGAMTIGVWEVKP